MTEASSPTVAETGETHLPSQPDSPAAQDWAADAVRDLTDRLNAARSYDEAAGLLDEVLEPTEGLLAGLEDFFEAAAKMAKASERQDGFDLYHDLQSAALTLRRLGEDLHVAVDRMHALAVPRRRSWQEAVADYYATAPSHSAPAAPPAGPSSGRTR
ncbi:hypothetical protein QQY66_33855 [Streptomyces sp. DG2A-72]|uniref:hypothetical protein n=1 Tax=Streptomyces sp. DG2A-72 TaxID=3051386 RepID=UPI00265C7C3F|nr:hypothetical protein [Streptomyces sp. DG2A-72]MDO0936445.1 hypothetical protein [Streptomyces sp. DG2A-72]